MKLSLDFKEFIQSLNDNHVRYLVVGGHAVAFHGHPRYTKDIDIWIEATQDNSERIIAALADFGFASLGLKSADFQQPGQVIQLGIAPTRIDILTSLLGVKFSECYVKRESATIDEVEVHFIDLENLKRNKSQTGRAQDIADVESLS